MKEREILFAGLALRLFKFQQISHIFFLSLFYPLFFTNHLAFPKTTLTASIITATTTTTKTTLALSPPSQLPPTSLHHHTNFLLFPILQTTQKCVRLRNIILTPIQRLFISLKFGSTDPETKSSSAQGESTH